MTSSKLLATALAGLLTASVIGACADDAPADVIPESDSGIPIVPDSGTPDTGTDTGTDAGPAKCGNGKIETGETCDDSNTTPGDGCSATCIIESAFEGDTCPGKPVTLTALGTSLTATVTGTTKGAFNHYGSACGGGSAPDVVYTFTPPSSGKATIKLKAGFSAIVSARSTCTSATTEIKCSDLPAATGGETTMELPVFAGTPVSVIVDGYAGSTGDFTLDIAVSAAVCGNGIAELPETCDDGNKTAGDGCSATCTLEAGGVLNACPGQPFLLTGPAGAVRKISFSGNTAKDGARSTGAVGCFQWNGSNVVYALKSDVDGAAHAKLIAGYDKSNLHVRTECTDTSYQLGCNVRENPGDIDLDFPVKAGQWFYLFVDGHWTSSKDYAGPFSVNVEVTPASCGNNVLDGNEECDDGNAATGDGCDATCHIEPTPAASSCPGHAVTLAAQADGSRAGVMSGTTTGRSNTVGPCASLLTSSAPDAIYAVTPDIDGLLDVTIEGPFNTTVSVLSSCAAPVGSAASVLACSYKADALSDPFGLDGLGSPKKRVIAPVVAGTTYYVVADSAVQSGTASSGPFELRMRITPPVCGNGVIEGTETCDDGGTAGGDGCSATCQLEPTDTRSTCALAENVTLTEGVAGHWAASLSRGTANLLANGNFFTSTLDDDEPCWAPGRNAFFAVTAPAAGVLRATAKSTAFDVVLGLRKPTCVLTGPAVACANDSGKGNEETLALPVAAGETVYVVVDGKTVQDFGLFKLDVTIEPSGCGDGFFVPSPTEQCDDGNKTAGDGCSATCTLEPKAGVDVCPGTPLTLSASGTTRRGTITFSTATLNANYTGACGGSAKDGVIDVVAPISGQLVAKVRNMPNATIYARSTCNDPSTEFLKTSSSTCPSVVHDVVTFSVTAGSHYYLFVDGLDGATGVPTVDVTVGP